MSRGSHTTLELDWSAIKSKFCKKKLRKTIKIKIMKEHIGSIRCLQIHENFDILISAGDAKFLCLWDINNGELLKRVHRNSINVNQMVTSPTHLILAGPNDPGQIATYDFQEKVFFEEIKITFFKLTLTLSGFEI